MEHRNNLVVEYCSIRLGNWLAILAFIREPVSVFIYNSFFLASTYYTNVYLIDINVCLVHGIVEFVGQQKFLYIL